MNGIAITAHTLPLDNAFAALPPAFYTRLMPTPLPAPYFVAASAPAASLVGLDAARLAEPDYVALLSGNAVAERSQPLSAVYSGHQFGVWAGQLGDGRAILLGDIATDSGPLELQLKGAGATPYSRMGDGRAVLRSSIREFLCSEAMHGLGIPTTRALALIGSPLPVQRERVETGAIVVRTAPSFLRFGHFEHFCHHARAGDYRALQQLLDFVIEHHHPACREAEFPAVAMLAEIARRTAEMIAAWQSVGFCHGVMNTDNLSVLGLTIDYGPFGFLDGFDPQHICNHSDHQGRYAFAQQPQIAWWNLHALAQALVPLAGSVPEEAAERLGEALGAYPDTLQAAMGRRMFAKLGLRTRQDGDRELLDDLMREMARYRADHTLVWRRLADQRADGGAPDTPEPARDLFVDIAAFDAWAVRYAARLRAEGSVDAERRARMNAVNPRFVLRNHLAEIAIQRAERGDFSEVQRLLAVLSRPFDEQPDQADCAALPPDWAQTLAVSCSS